MCSYAYGSLPHSVLVLHSNRVSSDARIGIGGTSGMTIRYARSVNSLLVLVHVTLCVSRLDVTVVGISSGLGWSTC